MSVACSGHIHRPWDRFLDKLSSGLNSVPGLPGRSEVTTWQMLRPRGPGVLPLQPVFASWAHWAKDCSEDPVVVGDQPDWPGERLLSLHKPPGLSEGKMATADSLPPKPT